MGRLFPALTPLVPSRQRNQVGIGLNRQPVIPDDPSRRGRVTDSRIPANPDGGRTPARASSLSSFRLTPLPGSNQKSPGRSGRRIRNSSTLSPASDRIKARTACRRCMTGTDTHRPFTCYAVESGEVWWRRRESNPRPSALGLRLYMLSFVYCFSPFDDPANRVSMSDPLSFSVRHRSTCLARSCELAPPMSRHRHRDIGVSRQAARA